MSLVTIDWPKFVERTEGANAPFIRELMRKSALFAADDGSETVENQHIDEAVYELVVEGGMLTPRILGFAIPNGP